MKRIMGIISLLTAAAAVFGVTVRGGSAGERFRGLTGTWRYEDGALLGSSKSQGDVFAISDETVAPDDLFVYEATVTSYTGNPDHNASLVFGLKDPDDPGARFYDFGIMTNSGRFLRFDHTDGKPVGGVDVGALSEKKNVYRVKIVRNSADEFEYFIDGASVLKKSHPDFGGGHIGMMTNEDGKYEDVEFRITGKVKAEENRFSTDLTGWEPINGTWKTGEKGYTAVSAGGDTWAYAKDREIPSGVPFIYEADVSLTNGNHAAGILFGVRDPVNGSGRPARLYSFLIARGDGNVMVFTHKDGAAEWIEAVGMTDADKKAEQYHMRMVFTSSGDADFYVNGTLYKSLRVNGYGGGYPGLMVSASTAATFNNVRLSEISEPRLEDLVLTGAELDSGFDPADRTYWTHVPYATKKISVELKYDEEAYSVNIKKAAVKSGKPKSVTLVQGANVITVSVTDRSSGVSTSYTINAVREPDTETLYKEATRPKFHFTPYSYQMNDPNGLVYVADTGEYHLFFQCNRPFDTGVEGLSGTTSWGHAVSKDLVHWQELPLAIMPDDLGMAWSGSAVIDRDNTSGLFDETTPPDSRMVLFYANVGGSSPYGYAKESMAYSKDGGRTFIKYGGNPVVKNPDNVYGGGLRDPKVFRYEDENLSGGWTWVMVTVGDLRIFTSKDLINWKHCGRPVGIDGSTFDSECPDLYPLPVDGDENNVKWVYTGGGIFYIIGHMEASGGDSVMFVPETEKIYALNGIADQGAGNPAPETYATQTFAAEKLGRRVSVSWLRDPSLYFKDKHWNSAQSVPMQHSLRTVDGKVKLFSYPVAEIAEARGDVLFSAKDLAVPRDGGNVLDGVRSECCDIEAVIDPGEASELGFKVRMSEKAGRQELVIRYDRTANKLYVDKMKTGGGSYLGIYDPELHLSDDGKLRLRILLDRICYDVYGGEGEAAVAGLVYSDPESDRMEFFTNGACVIESLTVYNMDESKNMEKDAETDAVTAAETQSGTEPRETEGESAGAPKSGFVAAAIAAGAAILGAAAAAALPAAKRKKKK